MKNIFISKHGSKFLTLLIGMAAVIVITSRFYFRMDVTEDDAYTLSSGSLAIAKKLPPQVTAKLYFTKSLKDMPVFVKQYAIRVEEVLREYALHSEGSLTIDVIDPKPDTDEEEWALRYGIQGVQLPSGENMMLGVVFIAGDIEETIPYLDPRKEEFLEYDLSEAMVNLRTDQKPKLGLLSSIPMSTPGIPGQGGGDEWALLSSLKNSFEVETLDPTTAEIKDDIKVLFLVQPQKLEDKTLYAIDQFVMRGGRLMVAIDPFSRVQLSSSPHGGMGQMPQSSGDLNKLFDAYGIAYDATQVVGDLDRGTQINAGGQRVIYPVYMTMLAEDISQDNKITSQLRQILFAEGGSLDVKKDAAIKMESLLTTGDDSGTIEGITLQFRQPADVAAEFKTDGKKRTLAAIYSGTFKSAFPTGAPEGGQSGEALKETKEENSIFVVADVDFMHDSNSVNKLRFGPQVLVSPRNDNLNLILNTAEFIGGNQDLISIRSSGQISRPFTKVLEIQKSAQQRWQKKEEELSSQLKTLQDKLSALQEQRTDGNRLSLSPEQQKEIERFREEEIRIRRERRIVRRNLREDIEALGHRVIAANMLITPLSFAGIGLFVFRRRSRREKEEKNHG